MTKSLISSSVTDALAEYYKNAGHWGSRSLPADVLQGSFVTHSNEPQRTFAGRLGITKRNLIYQGRTIRRVMGGGGGGIFVPRKFFSLSNSFINFSFRPQHEYFLGLIGVHKFFSFNFPLREYIYFLYFARRFLLRCLAAF